jgi:hypothetical protein
VSDGEERLIRHLVQGHPEVDTYEPPDFAAVRARALVNGSTSMSRRHQHVVWLRTVGLGAAAFLVAVIVVNAAGAILPLPSGSHSPQAGDRSVTGPSAGGANLVGRSQGSGNAKELLGFVSLAEMVATSDSVVEATVTAVRPGRVLDLNEGGATYQFTDVEVSISQVLAGSLADATVTLEVDPGLFPNLGRSKVWPITGERYFLFLHKKDDKGLPADRYRPISSNGVLLVDGAVVRSEQTANALGASLDGASVDSIRAAIQDAAAEIDAGSLHPIQPNIPTAPPTK